MAKWLSSSRKKRIRDIRSFIPVHGKILKPASTSLSHESSPGADPVSSETLGTHVVAAWASSGAKQLSLVQLNKKATALAEGRRPKVPASSFSTGIRRKVALTGSTNSEKEEAVTGRGMLEDKENFSDHMLSQTSLGLPTKKSKVLRFQICCTRTTYLAEIHKNRTIKVGAAKLFSVNSSWT